MDVGESLTAPVAETEPIADPTEPSEPDTATDSGDSTGETETVSTDEPVDDTDTTTEAEPDTGHTSGVDNATQAGKRTDEASSEDGAVQSDRSPRRGPRTATSPSRQRASTDRADRAEQRSTPRGSGRDNSRTGTGK